MALETIRTVLVAVLVILGIYLLHLLAVSVHEAGHLIVGYLAGMQSKQFRVGPITYEAEIGLSIKIKWKQMFDGLVLSQFSHLPRRAAAWRYFAGIVAGPLASIVMGILCMPLTITSNLASSVAAIVMLDSFLIALFTLIPFRQKDGRTTDGHKLWTLLFNPNGRRRLLFVLTFYARIEELKRLCKANDCQGLLNAVKELRCETAYNPGLAKNEKWLGLLTKLESGATHGTQKSELIPQELPLTAI